MFKLNCISQTSKYSTQFINENIANYCRCLCTKPSASDATISQTDEQPLSTGEKRLKLPLDFNSTEARKRPTLNPKDTSIILFPGQGTQYVGMAKNLLKFPQARSIFELANEVLKYDLLKICLEGPKRKLDSTEYAQPAVLVSSLAALEQLREERPYAIDKCVATAGFSLGEITALVFAGALPFDKALKLVQIRASAMQMACDEIPGSMAVTIFNPDAKIGLACEKATQWCLDRGIESPYCGVANYLYPQCKVLAGNAEALKFLETNMKMFSIRRMKPVPVSGAFHTPLMQAAMEPFTKALKRVQIQEPLVRVYSNVDGKPYKNAAHILRQLPKQIVRPVKWEQCMHFMYERKQGSEFPRTFECGPGKGLMQILDKVNAKAASTAYSVEA